MGTPCSPSPSMAPPLLLLLAFLLPLALSWQQPPELATRDNKILCQVIYALATREPPATRLQDYCGFIRWGFKRWGRNMGRPGEPEPEPEPEPESLESRSQGIPHGGLMRVEEEWIKRN